jgi:LmbE family N-acetylglucosaminyl deacetylase
MRVLAIGAHPDDLETLCGGTLARFAREGHEVVMCHAANGGKGSYVRTSEEISRIRIGEARRAAEICGAEHVTLGLPDGEVLAADPVQRSLFVDLIRDARPDLIITHTPEDYHPDHNETSRLVFDTSFLATVPLVVGTKPCHSKVTPIYFMEPASGLGFVPTEFVDVTGVIDIKEAMVRAHESQVTWLREHAGGDLVGDMKTISAFRGQQCGVSYAEGFAPCLTALRCTTYRLLP